MSASRVGPKGGADLATALSVGTALLSLDLTDNPMEPSVGPAFAALLSRHPNLTTLALNDLCLQDGGVTPLATALAAPGACPSLSTLELAQNEITRESTPAIARALAAHERTLRRVNLADNEFECAGAIHVATGLCRAFALEELDLRSNQIGRAGALEVARCCCAGKPVLAALELDGNIVSDEGMAEVCFFPR
jgi:Ran GTPase-activating protein (RanGAP) involved in mRNA processing and transport